MACDLSNDSCLEKKGAAESPVFHVVGDMMHHGMVWVKQCSMCKLELESCSHPLIHCRFTYEVWLVFLRSFNMYWSMLKPILEVLVQWHAAMLAITSWLNSLVVTPSHNFLVHFGWVFGSFISKFSNHSRIPTQNPDSSSFISKFSNHSRTTTTTMGVEEANPAAAGQPQPESSSPENVEALLEAARYNDIEDITSLASTGVSLDSKDTLGRTALHMAAANGHVGVVEYLIRNGVDLNASNVDKNTPLHWACLNGHIEVVKSLILAGAHVSTLNSYERTPVDEALSQGKMDVIEAINTAVTQLELSGVSVS